MDAIKAAAEPTALDRIVGAISPSWQLSRTQARMRVAAMGFVAASTTRPHTKAWTPGTDSADSVTLPALPMLRARSRDAVRNQPIAAGAFNTATTETLGTGFQVKATPDREVLGLSEAEAEAWEHQAERIFRVWSTQCDIARRRPFGAMHRVGLLEKLAAGDVLIVRRMKKYPGDLLATKIQLVEAERVTNPENKPDNARLVAGVKTDRDGAPVGFHVANRNPLAYTQWGKVEPVKWVRVPAFGRSGERLAWLNFAATRTGQTRGVPWLAPVLEPLRQISDFGTAELHAAVVNSLLVVISRPKDPDGGYGTEATTGDDKDRLPYELGSGLWLEGNPGDEFEVVDPKRPNGQFETFVLAWMRQIGTALGIPFELLVKHFSSSFSASQAAMLQAWRLFRCWQQDEVNDFTQPIYELVLAEAIANGLLDAPGFFDDPMARAAWTKTKWIGPGRGMIRPDVEIKASKMAIDEWLSTAEDESARLFGTDWEQNFEQRGREIKRMGGTIGEGPSPLDTDTGDREQL